jgi:hypothetical protein
MNIKEKEKDIADAFTSITFIYTSYCESCEMWIVHCPECNHNWCGGGCDCGYNMLLNRKQAQLDQMLLTLEGEK